MSNQRIVELNLEGNVPSKKNSRARTRTGVSIPSKAYQDWEHDAMYQVKSQTRERFVTPVRLDIVVYFGTNRRADLDNRITSLLDMLVETITLRDDKWQDVPEIHAKAEYRKNQPGAFIRITELGID